MNPETTWDTAAELALLGACLISDIAIEDSSAIISPDDFSAPRHQHLYAQLVATLETGQRTDIVELADGDHNTLTWLHELQNATYTASHATRYAERIAAARLRADIIHATSDIATLAQGTTDAAEVAETARERFAHLDMPAGRGAPDPDIDTFIGSVDTEYDWLIPDFLERGDRMLVTAVEGGGKSVLLAQIAVMAAAGIHPWTIEPVAPRNVAIIDLENSARMLTRRLGGLRQAAGNTIDPQRLRVHARPSGIDLTTRSDRRWLIDRCNANNTELLVIGPAYRMASGVAAKGDTGGEDQAKKVTAALDDIRHRCGITLILETHAPHGGAGFGRDLRPFGSSVWLRWPEFGIGLRKENPDDPTRYLVEHWRGPRDVRTWPDELHRGKGKWSWTPIMPHGTYRKVS